MSSLKLGAPSVIKKPPVRRLRHVPWSGSSVLPLSSIGNLRESKTRNPIRSLSHDNHLTPDPSGLQFKPGDPYATIPDGSGLKFGQVYGMLSPRLRQILAEPLNLTVVKCFRAQFNVITLDPRTHAFQNAGRPQQREFWAQV